MYFSKQLQGISGIVIVILYIEVFENQSVKNLTIVTQQPILETPHKPRSPFKLPLAIPDYTLEKLFSLSVTG